jgi:hypothetical protein
MSDPLLIKNPFSVKSQLLVFVLDSIKIQDIIKTILLNIFTTAELPSGNKLLYNIADEKLNYVCGKNEEKEYANNEMYDYHVSAETLNSKRTDGKTPHKNGVPYSFLQVKNELDGIEWYRTHYPKMPEELLPIMARYNWGEPITKKAVKNEKKKLKKKEQKLNNLEVKSGSFTIDFN